VLSKSENSEWGPRARRLFYAGRDLVVRLAKRAKELVIEFLDGFKNPAFASKSYRFLARQIALDMSDHDQGKLIVFSSATDMDTSSEILLMFAHFLKDELVSKVLIVDATLNDTGLTNLLGMTERPGIIDVASVGDSFENIDGITVRLGENISFLATGTVPKQRLPYLTESQADALIEELKEDYDYVIVQQDNICSDTRYHPIAQRADLVLLHLEEQATSLTSFDEIKEVFMNYNISNVKYIMSES